MSYSNGLLNFKGEITLSGKRERGEPGVGFKLADDGNYDIDNKKLTNAAEGNSSSDAVNKYQLTVSLSQKHDNTGNIDMKDSYNIINSKPQTFDSLQNKYDSLLVVTMTSNKYFCQGKKVMKWKRVSI